MQVLDDNLILSASDLNNFLACRHLTTLDLARARGQLKLESEAGADAELLARKGDEYERKYLESLIAEGREVVEITSGDGSRSALSEAAAATEDAMVAGAEIIYQGTFLRDGLRGHTDFLFRVDGRASDLGDYSYEVADTKLARRAKPYFIVQLCFYSELLAAVQGLEPEQIHVILGSGEQHAFRLAEFSAYFRHIRDEFLAALHDGSRDTYPEPVDHCRLCRWRGACDERRVADDHLSLVANISRRQRELLGGAGIETLAALGRADGVAVDGITPAILERLQEQASLQLGARESGEQSHRVLAPQEGKGFGRLPRPSEGDVFFDMEGDPFFDGGGLEYLFGLVTNPVPGQEEPPFLAIWGRDRAEEKTALELFIQFVTERRREFPDLHVYHYAAYEITALKRLAASHGTCEEELDQLLRDQVFVDLFKVVREAVRISQPSYSIKKVEAFYMDERETAVTDGGDSVIMFERWLEDGDETILEAIADYNRDDCLSTLKLRDWLLGLRSEAERTYEGSEAAEYLHWFEAEPAPRGDGALAIQEQNEALAVALLTGVSEDPLDRDEDQRARWLMAQLLEYHHREARPVWWAFFDRQDSEPAELAGDADCIGDLNPDESAPPRPEKKSLVYQFGFPAQETKLGKGSKVFDAVAGRPAGEITEIDTDAGRLELKRGPSLSDQPLPRALMPGGPYGTVEQQGALRRLAAGLLAAGSAAPGARSAAEQILRREPPRLRGRAPGVDAIDHDGMEIEELKEVVASLEDSYLFVQGPPGSGKTWSGARLIVDLVGRGHRVGVTSSSHKVIHNLLGEVEAVAHEESVSFRGLKKASAGNPESEFDSEHGLVESVADNAALSDPEVDLTAGTAWHYCREDTAPLDYLFIDEAGQISLADALALATSARNVVLLGDPQQLPQVAQGSPSRRRLAVGAGAPARRCADGRSRPAASSSRRPGACTRTSAASSPS